MGRWRPPAKKSSPYITVEGYRALEEESKQLWQKRSEVTQALSAAAAEGDRSENAEYIYRKKQLRELDRRITYLQRRMPKLKLVSKVNDEEKIYFGAWVTLEDEDGSEKKYRIVGADEIDPKQNFISIDAPLARALLGKSLNDEVIIKTEGNESCFLITRIQYN